MSSHFASSSFLLLVSQVSLISVLMAMPTEQEIRARQEAASRAMRHHSDMQQVYAQHRQQSGVVPWWQKQQLDGEEWDSWVASRRQLDRAVAVEKEKQHSQDAVHNQQLKKQKQPKQLDGEAWESWVASRRQLDRAQDAAHREQLNRMNAQFFAVDDEQQEHHAQDAVHDEQQEQPMQSEAHSQQLEQLQQQAQDADHHQQLKKPMQHAQNAVHDKQQNKQMLLSQWRQVRDQVQRMDVQGFAAPAAQVDAVLASWIAESKQCDEQTSCESKELWFVVQ